MPFLPLSTENYSIYIAPITGYSILRCEGATFTATPSGDGSGTVSGSNRGRTIILWYENTPDTDRMDYLISNQVQEQGSGQMQYTAESWAAYQTALANAEGFEITAETTQVHIDEVVDALELAQSNLVVSCEATEIISLEKLTPVARFGKQVGLRITTTPDVKELSIDGESFTLCVGKVQTLKTGETVKIWLVHFPADEVGEFTYTLHAGSESQSFDVTVQ